MIKITTKVCASITDTNKKDIIKRVNQIKDEEIDYIEIRLDLIDNITSSYATEVIEAVKKITPINIILTNRTKIEGGQFDGTEEERIKILSDNAHLVELTDVELSTDKTLRQKVINNANKTIISYHNFDKTPSTVKLQKIIDEAFEIGDIPKIAIKPNKIEDTYVLLRLLMDNEGIIAISMDKLGTYTRIMAPLMGSPVTYASVEKSSAPGQLDIKTTIEIIKQLQ